MNASDRRAWTRAEPRFPQSHTVAEGIALDKCVSLNEAPESTVNVELLRFTPSLARKSLASLKKLSG